MDTETLDYRRILSFPVGDEGQVTVYFKGELTAERIEMLIQYLEILKQAMKAHGDFAGNRIPIHIEHLEGRNAREVLRLSALGVEQIKIAVQLGISRQRVSQIQIKHGISSLNIRRAKQAEKKAAYKAEHRKQIPQNIQTILKMYADGFLIALIAKELNVHIANVSSAVRRHAPHMLRRHKRTRKEMAQIYARIYELADAGAYGAEIARQMGLHQNQVYQILKRRTIAKNTYSLSLEDIRSKIKPFSVSCQPKNYS